VAASPLLLQTVGAVFSSGIFPRAFLPITSSVTRPVSPLPGAPSAHPRRDGVLATIVFAGASGALLALALAAGCSYDRAPDADVTFKETGGSDVRDAQVFEVGEDGFVARDKLCGDLHAGTCDPDRGEICTRLDAGADGGADSSAPLDGNGDSDATTTPTPDAVADASRDAFGSGTTRACRVVKEGNKATTTCGLAGVTGLEETCVVDADCRPGLACVGTIIPRCLPYCCGATPELDPCRASGRYCAPLARAQDQFQKVPVCLLPDDCTLLSESTEECQTGTTCTVVTKFGDTSCVPIGKGLDLSCCEESSDCGRNYACLGAAGARVCRKLCHEGHDEECTLGTCQKVSSIPAGFGLCSVGDAGSSDGGCK
jgi:hypothetical protein